MAQYNEILLAAEKKAERAVETYRRTLIDTQVSCRHSEIVEGGHSATLRPFRVCTKCGYAEEGWGSGYSNLNNNYKDVKIMSRDEASKYVRGVVLSQDVHWLTRVGRSRRESLRKVLEEHQEVSF